MRDEVSGRYYYGFFGGYLYTLTDSIMRPSVATANNNTTFAKLATDAHGHPSRCSFCGILHTLARVCRLQSRLAS